MSLNTLSGSDSRDLSVRYSAGRIPVRFSRVLPGYPERPGRYFLPSGFTPVWITRLLTNPFSLFYLLPNLKLPILVLIWGLEQKN
jgi:hypothetical protein